MAVIVKYKKQSLAASTASSTLAEEAISSIRNVTAFNTQEKMAIQYDKYLAKVKKVDLKMRIVTSFIIAFMMGAVQLFYVRILIP